MVNTPFQTGENRNNFLKHKKIPITKNVIFLMEQIIKY